MDYGTFFLTSQPASPSVKYSRGSVCSFFGVEIATQMGHSKVSSSLIASMQGPRKFRQLLPPILRRFYRFCILDHLSPDKVREAKNLISKKNINQCSNAPKLRVFILSTAQALCTHFPRASPALLWNPPRSSLRPSV